MKWKESIFVTNNIFFYHFNVENTNQIQIFSQALTFQGDRNEWNDTIFPIETVITFQGDKTERQMTQRLFSAFLEKASKCCSWERDDIMLNNHIIWTLEMKIVIWLRHACASVTKKSLSLVNNDHSIRPRWLIPPKKLQGLLID